MNGTLLSQSTITHSSHRVEAPAVSAIAHMQPLNQGVDWTQLPDACRLLMARHMDRNTRAAWRTVCKATSRDVDAATSTLLWQGHIRHLDPTAVPLPRHSACERVPTTFPADLFAKLSALHHLTCGCMSKVASLQGIPPTLRSLELTSCDKLSDIAPLKHCTALEQLTLVGLFGDEEGLAATMLPAMSAISPHLRRLTLRICDSACDAVTEAVAHSLQPLSQLQELAFAFQPEAGVNSPHWATIAHAVQQMTDLEALDLSRGGVYEVESTGDTLFHLAPAISQLKRLHSLDIQGTWLHSQATEALAQSLSSMPATLTRLDAANACIDKFSALAPVLQAHSATLRSLSLRGIITDGTDDIDQGLQGTPLGRQGLKDLAPGLQICSTLTCLNLEHCHITARGAGTLATALSGSAHCLTSLNLSCNRLKLKGVAALAPVLSRMTSLATLDFHLNELCGDAATVLAPALTTIAPTLTSLNLSANSFQGKGVATLAAALRCMTALATLEFQDANLGPAEVAHLAPALMFIAPSLKSLNISSNRMGEGFATLAPALHRMTALELLSCRNNDVGCVGAAALAFVLPFMTRLQHLDIMHNPIEFEGLRLLAQGLAGLAGQQRWKIHFDRDLVKDKRFLRYSEDALALAAIIDGLSCLQHWEVCGAYRNSQGDTHACKVYGVDVRFSSG